MKLSLVEEMAENMPVFRVDAPIYDSQLEQVMQLYQERLYKAAYRYLGSHDAVEDVLQLTWIKLHDQLIKLGQLPAPPEALYPWLWVVARHVISDYQKKQGRVKSLTSMEGCWVEEPRIKASELPDTIVIRHEIGEALCQALSSLPPKQREVCELYFFQGLRLSDIAIQLQCKLNTIKSYLYRDGVPILRTALREWGIRREDVNFWAGHKESTLEQYGSGVYAHGNRSGM